jgi:DUF4097 and DUF4098 domain-containing protein YvlB
MPSKIKITIFCLFSILLLQCGCTQDFPQQQYALTFSPTEIQSVEMKAQEIPLTISPSNDDLIHISYSDRTGTDQKLDIQTENGILTIVANGKAATKNINFALPPQSIVKFHAFNTDFSLQNVSGTISVETIDGDITALDLEGNFVLRSGRGNIDIANSQGDISVFGEHGDLTLDSTHGDIDASNVIGIIQFTGQVLEGDDIFLETDHGAVTATLLDSDNAFLKIWTANGSVTCLLPQVETSSITCMRDLSAPVGKFQIKTVWGAIRVDSGR